MPTNTSLNEAVSHSIGSHSHKERLKNQLTLCIVANKTRIFKTVNVKVTLKMENWRDKSGNSTTTTAVWKDKKSKNSKSVSWRNKDENQGQNCNKFQNNFRRNHNDATHAVASSDKCNLFDSEKNKYECAEPKTLENILKISDDAKLISILSSERNGFLAMLEQPNSHCESDSMCLILDALARASETSSEQDTVQLLGLFYLKIIPKLSRDAIFHCELKLYIADLGKHLAEQSPQRHKHIEAEFVDILATTPVDDPP